MANEDGKCVMKVYWPFPFVIISAFIFFINSVSEITTKTVSRFKEATISLMSLPEIGVWIAFVIAHYSERGPSGAFMLSLIALMIYVLLNLLHACIHCRRMIPNSQQSYKNI